MPVDIAKTRIQNQKIVDGVPEYKGAVDVIKKVHFPSQVKIGLTLKCQLKEVPLLSHRPPPTTTTTPTPTPTTITSKFFGGKFKHLNRKISEFLAGN